MDLNMMMRAQARTGLQAQLDKAVNDGEVETARKIADDIAKLDVSTAPKAPAFGQAEITAELDKHAWFGVDPRKSKAIVELGKTMDPKKFATAAAFAEALVKAVDEEFKPAAAAAGEGDGEEDDDEEPAAPPAPKPRKTDGPGEGDNNQRAASRRASGPWTKLTDAPADIQAEVKRSADRLLSSTAPKEQREKFIARALESHYAAHQRKGKK